MYLFTIQGHYSFLARGVMKAWERKKVMGKESHWR